MNPEEGINALEKYGINLTKLAQEGKIDPVIGREPEIRRMIQILSRRTKNNPVLIGEPGTGKTTVVEGLARRIVEGDVPENIKNKEVYTLDLSAMIAGAMFRGQFEERLKNFIKQVVEKDGEIIVFIDELHSIVGAGNAEGQMDVSNIIKPELARGRMKLIGATTLNEYQKYIEKDAALERRFQKVLILEPTVEDTVTILRGIKDKYEIHHGLHIQDASLIAAATLSDRYITERFLPDKAVDLMDEAAAKIRMEINSSPVEIDTIRRRILQLEIEKEVLKKEKDARSKERIAVLTVEIADLKNEFQEMNKTWQNEKLEASGISEMKEKLDDLRAQAEQSQRSGDYQTSARILYGSIPEMENKIQARNESLKDSRFLRLEVTPEDIAGIVSNWTGIQVTKLLSGEKEKLSHLEDILQKRVIGQDEAIGHVADVIRMSKMGVIPQDRPIGSFLFLGKTGVGKTELAKALAEVLFENEKALVRIDMSEFIEQHSVAKLIGSPPGYVGYDEGGQLTEQIRRRPYSVVLFDEIEKAHPDVLNILLQVLDDGRLTDTKGRIVNFKNTILIMTSNLKNNELRLNLRPEFINRIDEIMVFNDLGKDVIRGIVDLQVKLIKDRLADQQIQLDITPAVIDYLVANGYNNDFGARPVKHLIKREILARLSRTLLENDKARQLTLDLEDGSICVKEIIEKTKAA